MDVLKVGQTTLLVRYFKYSYQYQNETGKKSTSVGFLATIH